MGPQAGATDGDRRVVVTGMGIISPLGHDTTTFWQGLAAGRSAVGPVTRFDADDYPSRIAAEVRDFDPADYMDRKDAKHADRFTQLAVAASRQALEDAELEINDDNADDVGVIIGSGIGGMETWETQFEKLLTRGPRRVSPFLVPMMISNMAAGVVSIITGARGPNAALVSACSSATHSIGEAYETVRRGDAQAMIAGGSEAGITRSSLAGFCAAKALSRRNDEPERASRPFDRDRDGFVIGEGSGVLILETLEGARERGAHIHAEIIGYGMSGDAYHMTSPSTDGAVRAMRRCLEDAGLRPEQVDYINGHATATPAGDPSETQAIKILFGDHAYDVPISANKSQIGHLLGAAGGVELIATILALQHELLPPTINLENPDPECDLDYVPNQARPAQPKVALNNSFGFGGQ
ncbi:MAG: beta-ketoacyl-ACP synthase II, partial [Armatimonadota bacterium]